MLRWGARPQPQTSFFGEEGGCRFVLCPIYPPYDHVWWWGTKGDRRISTKQIRWLSIFQVSTWLPTKWFNGFKVCETRGRTVRGYLKEGQAQNHDCHEPWLWACHVKYCISLKSESRKKLQQACMEIFCESKNLINKQFSISVERWQTWGQKLEGWRIIFKMFKLFNIGCSW